MEQKFEFPASFWWGGATSGPQSEGAFGKKHDSIMDHWYKQNPEDFFKGVGPETASDFYHHYEEDFAMMKQCGFNSFRTSIQWTRLIRDFESGEEDEEGAAFYRKVIECAKKNNIELILNLHHFDLPAELFQKYGGWESKHVVDLFVRYAETAFRLFGQDVRYWTTFNEPIVIPEAGYMDGHHFPKYKGEGKRAMQVIFNLNLASQRVISLYKEKHYPGQIGIILNLTPAYPASDCDADREAAEIADEIYNNSFLAPAVQSVFSEKLISLLEKDDVLFDYTEQEMDAIHAAKVDFLGVNYYHPKRVRAQSDPSRFDEKWMAEKYFEDYDWPEKRINPYRGWEIYPQAIYDIAVNIRDNLGNIPWFISENGMGVEGEERFRDENGIIQDDYRIGFYKEHLYWLHRAMQEGCNVFGYHAWAAMDCWSWSNAYKNRYGFISVDIASQKRTIKKSGKWLKQVSEDHYFMYDPEEKNI